MQRREYLLGTAATLGGLAGCAAVPGGCRGSVERAGQAVRRPQFADVSLPVPRSELVVGAPSGAIRAIETPSFGPDWRNAGRTLDAGDVVIGVTGADHARAYPLALLERHEIVNDVFPPAADDESGRPLVVTYCPLCASGVTAVRTVDGQPTIFSVSGFLYRSDLVLYDHTTGSFWSQIMATAINGPATGTELELVPSSLTTWERWQELHPETEVLLPPAESETVAPPLDPVPPSGSAQSGHVGVGGVAAGFDDDLLPARELVVGVTAGGAARAYPRSTVSERGAVNDCLEGVPVVVATDKFAHAYVGTIDGRRHSFERADDHHLRGGGSTWRIATGRAVDGPHEGEHLRRASRASSMYWFAWLDFHPETDVYGVG